MHSKSIEPVDSALRATSPALAVHRAQAAAQRADEAVDGLWLASVADPGHGIGDRPVFGSLRRPPADEWSER